MIESDRRVYTKAPIIEALIHIGIQPPEGKSFSVTENVYPYIKEDYPDREEIQRAQIKFDQGLMEPSQVVQVGYKYSTSDKKQILQAQIDGFTFSRLAPYTTWEDLRNEAQRLWKFYQESVAPLAITRLAVRYINKLDLPLPIRDFRDYLRTYPEVSSDMPIGLEGYLMQLQIPYPEQQAIVTLSQTLLPLSTPEFISIQLDIEVTSSQVLGDEDSWATLEKLRTIKNEMFEASITNRTRELIR
ncbi:MAG: TIGR04255 family protein [Gloeobacterales cyanobacterium]